jgi:hypothetical protein
MISTISRRHPSAKQAHPEIIQNKSHNGQARFVAVAETGIVVFKGSSKTGFWILT